MTTTIKSGFIGEFKLGDNINYNLKILRTLYNLCDSEDANIRKMLLKPIIILNVSIAEAVLHDFISCRAKLHTREGVKSVFSGVLDYIRGKKIDEFEKYIACARKHNLLKVDASFYDLMDNLRKLRNRVHIQNAKCHFELDDEKAFTLTRKVKSEEVLKTVLQQMATHHLRPEGLDGHVDDFVLPF